VLKLVVKTDLVHLLEEVEAVAIQIDRSDTTATEERVSLIGHLPMMAAARVRPGPTLGDSLGRIVAFANSDQKSSGIRPVVPVA
jgi:hypothetical protein